MNIDEIKESLKKAKQRGGGISLSHKEGKEVIALIEAVETGDKKIREIWDALKGQTKELARAYDKIESMKERIEMAIDYLPESPHKAMGFLKASK